MSVRTYDPKPRDVFPPALCTAGCGKPYYSICKKCNLAYCFDHLRLPHACEKYPAAQYPTSEYPPPSLSEEAEEAFLDVYAGVVVKAKELLVKANHTRPTPDEWPAGQKWTELAGTSKSIFMSKARAILGIDEESFLKTARIWPYSAEGMDELNRLFSGEAGDVS